MKHKGRIVSTIICLIFSQAQAVNSTELKSAHTADSSITTPVDGEAIIQSPTPSEHTTEPSITTTSIEGEATIQSSNPSIPIAETATITVPPVETDAITHSSAPANNTSTESSSLSPVKFGVNLNTSTLGFLGIGGRFLLNEWVSFDLGINFGSTPYINIPSNSPEEYKSKTKINFNAISLLANVHPFAGTFRVVGGIIFNNMDIKMDATSPLYPSANLAGKVSFNKTAPYLGIGWGGAYDSNWGVMFDLGVMFQGKPSVSLKLTGTPPVNPPNIPEEEQAIQNAMNKFTIYPVATLKIYYQFDI